VLSYPLRFPHKNDVRVVLPNLQLFVEGLMSYLRYLWFLAYSGVQHILCCFFVLILLRLVYPMLPFFLNSPFLIIPSVFSNVYSNI